MTDIARDVILDLLPLVLADEASPATRALVESYLAAHPDLQRSVHEAALPEGAAPEPPADLALVALRRTRRALTLQRWLFGLALTFTAVALGIEVRFEQGRIQAVHLLLFQMPWPLGAFLVLGIAGWIGYALVGRRLRAIRERGGR